MDWLIRKPTRRPQLFSTWALPILPGGTLRRLYYSFDRLQEPNRGNEYGLASPCGCRVYFLVPIFHPTTATGRDAFCFFLNIGN
jgi:hypothetical protein